MTYLIGEPSSRSLSGGSFGNAEMLTPPRVEFNARVGSLGVALLFFHVFVIKSLRLPSVSPDVGNGLNSPVIPG